MGLVIPAGGSTLPIIPAIGTPTFPAIGSLELRLSTLLGGVTIDGNCDVSAMTDWSGKSRNAAQATAGKRPRYIPHGFNHGAWPCWQFSRFGGPPFLNVASMPAISQPCSVVMVMQNYTDNTGNANLYRGGGGSPGGAVGFLGTGPAWFINGGASLSSSALYTQTTSNLYTPSAQYPGFSLGTATSVDSSNPCVRVDVFNSTSSSMWCNGVQSTVGDAGTAGLSANLNIGGDGSSSYATCLVCEFLVFSKALTSTDVANLDNYYNAMIGLALI